MHRNSCKNCVSIPGTQPSAWAQISGSADYPNIHGTVYFYPSYQGVIVVTEVFGLPFSANPCMQPVFGYHIHSGSACTGTDTEPFADALTHYNPDNCPHPAHAGDLPPLFGNQGYAFLVFLTDRFTAEEIIGKTIIIHDMPDDFTSQPAGNSGNRIACGEILAWKPF